MDIVKGTVAAVAVIALLGCSGGEKEKAGTVIGAGLGALAGAHVGKGTGRLIAVAVGTLAGAALGGEVGKSLDRADRLAMERSTQHALEKTRRAARAPGATQIRATRGRLPRPGPTGPIPGSIAANTSNRSPWAARPRPVTDAPAGSPTGPGGSSAEGGDTRPRMRRARRSGWMRGCLGVACRAPTASGVFHSEPC